MHNKFTLIEMLVVIAIIGIIAAMLMPALRQAIDSANTASCANNQRQLYLGIIGYSNDWSNRIITGHTNSTGRITLWPVFVSGKQGDYTSDLSNGSEYVAPGGAFGCPANEDYSKELNTLGRSNRGMAIYAASSWEHKVRHNWNFASWWRPVGSGLPEFRLQNMLAIPAPAKIIMLADSLKSANYRTNSEPMPTIAGFNGYVNSSWGGRIHLVHNQLSNTAFYDGHVEIQGIENMYDGESMARRFYDMGGNAVDLP